MYLEENRRSYPRRTAFIIAEYTIGEETHRDVIKNIGAGGLFVRSWKKVVAGQAITLRFPLFNFEEHIQVTGTVSHTHSMGFAVTFDKPIDGLICREGYFPEIVHESDQLS